MSGEDYDEDRETPDFNEDHNLDSVLESGCLYPAICCMPGPHYTCECHTAEMMEEQEAEHRYRLSMAAWTVAENCALGLVFLFIGYVLGKIF